MQKLYFMLIILVFVISILFAVIIWVQTGKIGEKALAAKQAKEEYLKQLMLEQEKEEGLAESRLQEKQPNIQSESLENQLDQTEDNPKVKSEDYQNRG